MFKSVFAKYIISFMLIIFISFALLVSIITGMVDNYAVTSKQQILSKTENHHLCFLLYSFGKTSTSSIILLFSILADFTIYDKPLEKRTSS